MRPWDKRLSEMPKITEQQKEAILEILQRYFDDLTDYYPADTAHYRIQLDLEKLVDL